MQEWGYMTGLLPTCADPNKGEEFGHTIIPAPDLNKDGITDFFIERFRCEIPTTDYRRPHELLLYYGMKNRLPKPEDGLRIGPVEFPTESHIAAIGDFDADGFFDIACRYRFWQDTSEGNTNADYGLGYVAIYWGNAMGRYSNDDTSRLECGYRRWLMPGKMGLGEDVNNDGIADVTIYGTNGYESGSVKPIPDILTYFGKRGERWGRGGKPRTADWSWFAPPENGQGLWRFDHDCDGYKDWVFVSNRLQTIAIAYGSAEATVADTNAIEAISIRPVADGWTLSATFSDVTGDRVPELQVHAGSEANNYILIYAGKQGQRLTEQFGPGKDSLDRATGRFPLRPWARIAMPHTLNAAWNNAPHSTILLGDLNNDNADEVAILCSPYLCIYTSGRTLDSLIDVIYNGYGNFTLLGNIDGSGSASIAFSYNYKVHFLKAPPKDEIPTYGGRLRLLPHSFGYRCEHASAVEEDTEQTDKTDMDLTQDPVHEGTRSLPRNSHNTMKVTP